MGNQFWQKFLSISKRHRGEQGITCLKVRFHVCRGIVFQFFVDFSEKYPALQRLKLTVQWNRRIAEQLPASHEVVNTKWGCGDDTEPIHPLDLIQKKIGGWRRYKIFWTNKALSGS